MSPKRLMQVKYLQKELSSNCWNNYLYIVKELCCAYPDLPYTSSLLGFVRARDIEGMVRLADSLSGQSYPTAAEHFAANQFAYIIKKYPFPNAENLFRPEEAARATFSKGEFDCHRRNQWFRAYRSVSKTHKNLSAFSSQLNQMRSFIRFVLGDAPNLPAIYDNCEFGPGANILVHGNATNRGRKILSRWSVSPSAYYYARSAVIGDDLLVEYLSRAVFHPSLAEQRKAFCKAFVEKMSICNHNKIAFVPKTVKTLRSIAVEPLLNGYLQKGVDTCMRHRLRRIGIDLSNQVTNTELARQGSQGIGDPFVTIDLSRASDSISIELCREVLPPEWFEFLNSIRSKSYLLDGVVRRYSKFCSMGNGFCFPLETLIFVACCMACGAGRPGRDFNVYGDDIVVRQSVSSSVIALLKRLGFATNIEKTFLEGPFRESCGTDWFDGVDVRPFVLDFSLGSLSDVFKFLNLSARNERSRAFFEPVWDYVFNLVPRSLRFVRPFPGPADTCITVPKDLFMSSPYAKWHKNHQCWGWTELALRPVSDSGIWELKNNAYALAYVAVRSSRSSQPFVLRRKTRTKIVVTHGSGALATWVPGMPFPAIGKAHST